MYLNTILSQGAIPFSGILEPAKEEKMQSAYYSTMSKLGPSHSRRNEVPTDAAKKKNLEKKRTRRGGRNKKKTTETANAEHPTIPLSHFMENIHLSQKNHQQPRTSKVNTASQVKPRNSPQKNAGGKYNEVKFSFTINAVIEQKYGRFIRRRNTKYRYVNLKSFIKNVTALPIAFETLSSLEHKQSVNKSIPKPERRKYPQTKRTRYKKESVNHDGDLTPFPEYMSKEAVESGLANGTLIKGFVRINPKNFRDSYVSNEDTTLADYYLTSVLDRNRALEGDEVVLELKPENEWIDGQKTARVVYIKEMIHPRIVVGCLKPSAKKKADYALLCPRDKRCPILRIPDTNLPNYFKTDPKRFEKILFVAKIISWNVPAYALGVLTENLGTCGDLKVETLSILREFCLDITPFSKEITESVAVLKEIPYKELEYREDLRKECIFTIDPETARDLDDAVSIKTLENGNYEVGVHISDASFFLEEGTELDQVVCKKATTIYLVDNVYHMLPVEMCLNCSLLPGEDRLSFSVFWEMNKNGEIISKRFTRSVMNSCVKLAYEHAQNVIENPDKEFTVEDFPPIHNGFEVQDIVDRIKILQDIAAQLRLKRMENGALKIDQVKLLFNIDPTSGEPLDFWKYENKEAHRLIEEYMLLANITVAEQIQTAFPNMAFLRCHEPPKQTMLVALRNSLASCGIHIDISSSKGICASMKKYSSDDSAGCCRAVVLNHLTAKAMTRARYFCAATEDEYTHYALSVPIYTHFTSPIRRYADIMVHRILAASLGYQEPPKWDVDYVTAIAANCNAQKYNAKRAGEASAELFLGYYIEKNQPFVEDCVVVDIKQRSFDAIVLKTGSIIRIYPNTCETDTHWAVEVVPSADPNVKCEKAQLKLTITFSKTKHSPNVDLIVEIFTIVKVRLERKSNSYKLEGTLLRPVSTQVFSSSKLDKNTLSKIS